jgi:hypothetical protein
MTAKEGVFTYGIDALANEARDTLMGRWNVDSLTVWLGYYRFDAAKR